MRQQGLQITFSNIGRGRTDTEFPAEDLIPMGQSVVAPCDNAYAMNLSLLDGIARSRHGYTGFGEFETRSVARPINGLYYAAFDNGTNALLAADKAATTPFSSDIYLFNSSTGQFETLTNVVSPANGTFWTWAMAPRAGAGSGEPGNQVAFCNGQDEICFFEPGDVDTYRAPASASSVVTGAQVLLAHSNRLLAMNAKDSVGTKRNQRIYGSILGDGETFSGSGSFAVDLRSDPFPIKAATVIGGRVVVYKGDELNGSIEVGTLTGSSIAPYRWDKVSDRGILLPRTLVQISEGMSFFVSHDGFYLHDGARGLVEVGRSVSREVMPRINSNATDACFAWYRNKSKEIVVGFATGASEVPNEFWVLALPDRRSYGPWIYPDNSFLVSTQYVFSAGVIWGDVTPGPLDAEGTWDANSYTTWDSIAGTSGTSQLLFGSQLGNVYADTGTAVSDLRRAIQCQWLSPAFVPNKHVMPRPPYVQAGRTLDPNDMVTLREVHLRYQDGYTTWIPTVEYSTDGLTWATISDSSVVGGSNSQRVLTRSYTAPETTSTWWQFRVTGNQNFAVHSLTAEFTYAGDSRNG